MNAPSPDELRATLEHLHQQLEDFQGRDPRMRQMLVDALHEIEEALHRGEAVPTEGSRTSESDDEDESLLDRLREAAQHFEEEHPVLSGTIGSMIDALGRMGI